MAQVQATVSYAYRSPSSVASEMEPMTKSDIAKAIAAETELKNSTASKIMNSLAEIITKEVKSTGKITIPGVVMIKTRFKPATKACKKEIFGKLQTVKAKPART